VYGVCFACTQHAAAVTAAECQYHLALQHRLSKPIRIIRLTAVYCTLHFLHWLLQGYYCLMLKLTIVQGTGRMGGYLPVPPFDLHSITQAGFGICGLQLCQDTGCKLIPMLARSSASSSSISLQPVFAVNCRSKVPGSVASQPGSLAMPWKRTKGLHCSTGRERMACTAALPGANTLQHCK
jgi:hypothetical protein